MDKEQAGRQSTYIYTPIPTSEQNNRNLLVDAERKLEVGNLIRYFLLRV